MTRELGRIFAFFRRARAGNDTLLSHKNSRSELDSPGQPLSKAEIFCRGDVMPISLRRHVRARVRPRHGPTLINRNLAIVDPLLIHPLLAESLLPGRCLKFVW